MIVDSSPTRRQRLARLAVKIGWRVSASADFAQLETFWPDTGVIAVHDEGNLVAATFAKMVKLGRWLPVVAYALDPDPARIVDVVRVGASDYFKWPMAESDLRKRLQGTDTAGTALSRLRRLTTRSEMLIAKLSPREREVLALLPRGDSNKEIARRLNLSPRTVELHRAHMMGKLGARSVAQAVSIAFYSGLVSEQSEEELFDPFTVSH
jgi:DNA-binding NarL/FixJ family response regulator